MYFNCLNRDYMNPLLKLLLIRRLSEQGFATLTSIAFGLIILLLAIISLVKSHEENIISITQRQKAQGLSAAEAGVARYRELINKNRILSIYDSSSWIPTGQPLCDSNTTISNAISSWQDVDSSDPSLGQYRLVSYDYSIADGNPPNGTTTGTLTVEGKINGATAAIKVIIPVRPEAPADYLQPALWLGNSPTSVGNLMVINGNILVRDSSGTGCPRPTAPTSTNLQNPSIQLIIADPRPLPNIRPQPSSSVINTVTSADLTSATSLPRSGDRVDANNYYHYRVTDSLNLSNKTIPINPGTKVILYVEGSSITFDGNVRLNESNPSPYLEIYGSASTTSIQFSGSGTINVNALIHAPYATVTTSSSPTVNINGAMWVNNWNASSGNITINPDATSGSPSYSFYSSKPGDDSKPTISTPTSWETVEVN